MDSCIFSPQPGFVGRPGKRCISLQVDPHVCRSFPRSRFTKCHRGWCWSCFDTKLILGKETGVAHSLEWVHFGWLLPHPTGSTLILLSAQSTQIFETVKKNQSQWNLLLNFDIFLVIIFDKFFWRRHSKPQITNQLSWAINLFKV